MAASATFALKAGVWFRRGRLLIVSPDSRADLARCQAETPLIPLFRFPEPALYAHTLVSNCNLSCAVVSHGVLFGRGISISGDGLSNLITIRPSHSEIGQQERKCNGG